MWNVFLKVHVHWQQERSLQHQWKIVLQLPGPGVHLFCVTCCTSVSHMAACSVNLALVAYHNWSRTHGSQSAEREAEWNQPRERERKRGKSTTAEETCESERDWQFGTKAQEGGPQRSKCLQVWEKVSLKSGALLEDMRKNAKVGYKNIKVHSHRFSLFKSILAHVLSHQAVQFKKKNTCVITSAEPPMLRWISFVPLKGFNNTSKAHLQGVFPEMD